MTPEEVRGQKLTLAIAIWVGVIPTVLSLVRLALPHRPATSAVWASVAVSGAVNLAFGWLLYKAYQWTRIYIAAALLLTALVPTARLLAVARHVATVGQFVALALFLLPPALNALIAVALWRSPAI